MTLTIAALGLLAGTLTTLTGQGGGLLLLLVLSPIVGPHAALALTTPALLVGNAHRALLFRRDLALDVGGRVVLGALPGALVGGLFASRAPAFVLEVALVGLTGLVVARAFGLVSFAAPRWALPFAGFVVGALTGTAGGAGILVAPLLMAAGLSGNRYVATAGLVGTAMHTGRVIAYGATGLLAREHLLAVAGLAVALSLGNTLGERLRARVPERVMAKVEVGALVTFVGLALAGFAKG